MGTVYFSHMLMQAFDDWHMPNINPTVIFLVPCLYVCLSRGFDIAKKFTKFGRMLDVAILEKRPEYGSNCLVWRYKPQTCPLYPPPRSSHGYMHMRIQLTPSGHYILGQFSRPFASIADMVSAAQYTTLQA